MFAINWWIAKSSSWCSASVNQTNYTRHSHLGRKNQALSLHKQVEVTGKQGNGRCAWTDFTECALLPQLLIWLKYLQTTLLFLWWTWGAMRTEVLEAQLTLRLIPIKFIRVSLDCAIFPLLWITQSFLFWQQFIFFVIKVIAIVFALVWTVLRWLLGNRLRSKVRFQAN